MNERIQQLADEAVTRVALRCEGSMESDKHGEWIRYDDLEKFAELIVKECAAIDWHSRLPILQHFGVEE